MTPTKPFLLTLALVAVGGAGIIASPAPREAAAQESLPLSTKLTPTMIDFFGLGVAFERPSMAALAACRNTKACGDSDSSTVRFLDERGRDVPEYDGKPTSVIRSVRRLRATTTDGATESRTEVRLFTTDEQGRVVMNGTDSITKIDGGAAGRPASTVTRVHRFTDVRYLVNDPRFAWPLTGMVVLELSDVAGSTSPSTVRTATHAAVNFDGTAFAHIITSGALTHRVNLQARLFETTIPDR